MTVSLIMLDLAMKILIAVTQQMEQNALTLFVDQLKVSSHKNKLFFDQFKEKENIFGPIQQLCGQNFTQITNLKNMY